VTNGGKGCNWERFHGRIGVLYLQSGISVTVIKQGRRFMLGLFAGIQLLFILSPIKGQYQLFLVLQ
jgi:hypothetical protein